MTHAHALEISREEKTILKYDAEKIGALNGR